MIGDSGGNVGGMRAVAQKLNTEWNGEPVVAHIPEYYTYSVRREGDGVDAGIVEGRAGRRPARRSDHHAQHVDHRSEVGALRRAREGGEGDASTAWIADRKKNRDGKAIVEFRATFTADAIKKAIAANKK